MAFENPGVIHSSKMKCMPTITDNNKSYAQSIFNAETAITIQHFTAGHESFFLEENVLLFVKEGFVIFSYGENVYHVGKGQSIYLKKSILLQYYCEKDKTQALVFVLKTELVIEFARLTNLRAMPGKDIQVIQVSDTTPGFHSYISSLQPYLADRSYVIDSLCRIKLLELLFCIADNDPSLLAQMLQVRETFHPNITQVVEENIMNPLSLGQLARLAGRSISSFRRDFLSIYNMPPSKWIRLRRLEKALELLTSTNMAVSTICYTLGFENTAHFSRVFKSHFGHSPTGSRSKDKIRVNPSHPSHPCFHTSPPQADPIDFEVSYAFA